MYSTLDLKNGFFHIAIKEVSHKYTAFVIPNGYFEFLRMPFGLSMSSAYFQKYVNAVFCDLMMKGIVAIYMNDLIILSVDMQEGLMMLKLILEAASKYGLKLEEMSTEVKVELKLKSKVNYLGYIIENGEITPSEEKINVVKHFPKSTNVCDARIFRAHGVFSEICARICEYSAISDGLIEKRNKVSFGKE